jgi:hypothetical protein
MHYLPSWLESLLTSRKFWLAIIALIGAIIVFVQGGIDAGELADKIVAVFLALILAIAAEDAAGKFNGNHFTQRNR